MQKGIGSSYTLRTLKYLKKKSFLNQVERWKSILLKINLFHGLF